MTEAVPVSKNDAAASSKPENNTFKLTRFDELDNPEECDESSCMQECLMGSFVDVGPDTMRFRHSACADGSCLCSYQSVCLSERCYNTCTRRYHDRLNGSACRDNQCYCVHS